jgi:capsular exopolysaccharide synthesis family protein
MIGGRGKHTPLVSNFPLNSHLGESYRMLRTSVLLECGDEAPRCIVVTSGERGEGKSVTAANLAIVMSRTDRRVALLDADLRIPTQHTLFDIAPSQYSYSAGELGCDGEHITKEFLDARYAVQVGNNLDVYPVGALPPDPSETIESVRFRRLVEVLRAKYDVVVIDSPPVSRATDAVVLSSMSDGVALVVDFRSRRRHAKRAVQTLKRVGTPMLGIVANRYDREPIATYGPSTAVI